jgi:Tfp pilus assembly protein PilV
MARRSGVTLVEVLVAIFVMGIGMIALLTLFPIGVLRMAQAINDERAAQAAYIAHENSAVYNIRNDPMVAAQVNDPYNKGQTNADLFLNPCPFSLAGAAALPNADLYGESYTLFVDPIGYYNSGTATPEWVGGAAHTGVMRRRPVSFVNANATNIYRSFTLWDDIEFSKVNDPTSELPGTPVLAGLAVMRNSRFSWGYTVRRPLTSEKSVVDCSVVVFDSRSLSLSANLNLGEYVYSGCFFNPNNNTVIVPFTPPNGPPIRAGNWIMDATIYSTPTGAGSQHNYWYRVLATQDVVVGVNTYAVFEVQGQIRGFNNYPTAQVADPTLPTSTAYPHGTVVIFDGVAEVFERGPVRTP